MGTMQLDHNLISQASSLITGASVLRSQHWSWPMKGRTRQLLTLYGDRIKEERTILYELLSTSAALKGW